LSDVQKLAIALARLSRFPKSSNTRQNDPLFISPRCTKGKICDSF
jgi:hypothetical protein